MQTIESILTIADRYDAIVFDQWGVLHDGGAPYPFAVQTITALHDADKQLAVLSNSGKSADSNRDRITAMGFPSTAFKAVMTSGEALRGDIASGQITERFFYPIVAKSGDAHSWATGLPVTFTDQVENADAILLMGLSDGGNHLDERAVLTRARGLNKLLICSNPDRKSPRHGGQFVESPGALAHEYADAGGQVKFYGKPHLPIFQALAAQLHGTRILMVGDSPEHDIAGAKKVGWDSLFISGGLHAHDTNYAQHFDGIGLPDYALATLR